MKTRHAALVVIPPEEIWHPIQAIRRSHDRHFRRWMPHITLLYPFLAAASYRHQCEDLLRACAQLSPFPLALRTLHLFQHGKDGHTLWLAPEPPDPIRELQAALLAVTPHCDDTARFPSGFTPHLSLGQMRGSEKAEHLCARIQQHWLPLQFMVDRIYYIRREEPPQDVFHIEDSLPLGSESA